MAGIGFGGPGTVLVVLEWSERRRVALAGFGRMGLIVRSYSDIYSVTMAGLRLTWNSVGGPGVVL